MLLRERESEIKRKRQREKENSTVADYSAERSCYPNRSNNGVSFCSLAFFKCCTRVCMCVRVRNSTFYYYLLLRGTIINAVAVIMLRARWCCLLPSHSLHQARLLLVAVSWSAPWRAVCGLCALELSPRLICSAVLPSRGSAISPSSRMSWRTLNLRQLPFTVSFFFLRSVHYIISRRTSIGRDKFPEGYVWLRFFFVWLLRPSKRKCLKFSTAAHPSVLSAIAQRIKVGGREQLLEEFGFCLLGRVNSNSVSLFQTFLDSAVVKQITRQD